MKFDPETHHRRSIRLHGYDYSLPGGYFITVCCHGKKLLLGNILGGEMVLNETGKMIESAWKGMPRRFATLEEDSYVIMPNHFHAIVRIVSSSEKAPRAGAHSGVGAPLAGARIVGAPLAGAPKKRAGTRPAPTVGDVVGAFKSITTNEFFRLARGPGSGHARTQLWQRNYYEHIIRNPAELEQIREYIATNPLRWLSDRENPDAIPADDM